MGGGWRTGGERRDAGCERREVWGGGEEREQAHRGQWRRGQHEGTVLARAGTTAAVAGRDTRAQAGAGGTVGEGDAGGRGDFEGTSVHEGG